MRVHHTGFLTADIKKCRASFLSLGYVEETGIIRDAGRGVDICFLINDSFRIELVQPVDKNSPLYPSLKRFKDAPYHICYEVEKIFDTIDKLTDAGYTLVQEAAPAPALSMRNVAFLQKRSAGLIELVEAQS